MSRLPSLIAAELDDCPLPWEVKLGTRHRKIFVGGRLAGILPMANGGEADGRAMKNVRSQIRRVIREMVG